MNELFAEAEAKQKLSSYEVVSRLERKYAPPSWGFFTEVKSSVGFGRRRADGIAVAMWRSLGLEIHGFEVKVSRQDWLNELKDGGKSDELFKFCNRWWLAVGDESIVKNGELPDGWGLQAPQGRGLKIVKKAPKLEPEALTVEFVAEILRRQFDSATKPEALQMEFQRGLDLGKLQGQSIDSQSIQRRLDILQKSVDDFEKTSGVKIQDWRAGDIGSAVRAILEIGPEKTKENLTWQKESLERLLREYEEIMSKM